MVPRVFWPQRVTARMLGIGGGGVGWGLGGRGRDLCRAGWRVSPVLFAFKAKREAALGEKPVESTVEVSGGLVAQVSGSVHPRLSFFSLSLLFLFSGINQCLPSPTHHFTNFKRYN